MSSDGNERDRTELDERLRDAATLVEEERWQEALQLLLAQERDHPEDPMLLCLLGATAREVGAEGQAYEYFRRCLAQNPADPVVLVTAGNGLAALDDPEAESTLRLAALTAPGLSLTRLHYGAYLAREGMYEPAIRELEAARALAEEDALVRLELATAYLLAERTAEGVEEMAEALAREAQDSWIRLLYALALVEEGRLEEAAEEMHRAAEDRPEDVEAQLLASLAAATQGWIEEAWNALARAEVGGAADPALLQEVEEALESDAEAAEALLRGALAPSALRTRLLERS